MRRIRDKVIIIDIVLTAILVIVGAIGIGIVWSKRPKTYTGELTTENYAKYIDVNCRLSNYQPSKDFDCNFYLVVSPKDGCDIYDIEITLEVISPNSDFGTYTLKAERLDYYNNVSQSGKVHYALDGFPFGMWLPNITVNVIAISGKYEYNERVGI
ncbi:MAG: hypothetical protein K2O39_05560 [Clostridiales bacterium]|nr:hypothetical protein [Clostridiales bacterium]